MRSSPPWRTPSSSAGLWTIFVGSSSRASVDVKSQADRRRCARAAGLVWSCDARPAHASRGKRAPAQCAPLRWLVTGSAGFIGSHCVERCSSSTSTSSASTISPPASAQPRRGARPSARRVAAAHVRRGDIADLDACRDACRSIDVVLHQAALGSVPRSIEDPLRTHAANATVF
jgi:hypothetical protein